MVRLGNVVKPRGLAPLPCFFSTAIIRTGADAVPAAQPGAGPTEQQKLKWGSTHLTEERFLYSLVLDHSSWKIDIYRRLTYQHNWVSIVILIFPRVDVQNDVHHSRELRHDPIHDIFQTNVPTWLLNLVPECDKRKKLEAPWCSGIFSD